MDTHIELKNGDTDTGKKWGGTVLAETPAYTVTELQKNLKSVGTFTTAENGIFGPQTEKSLKIFQWVCANMTVCIKAKARATRLKTSNILASGKLDKSTYDELAVWVKDSKKVTGDLIRVPFSGLSNIEAGPSFKKTGSTKVQAGELVMSSGAKALLTKLNEKAKEKKVTIKINQVFREHGVKVSGAVVPPASKSQHLIGHALDCNIVDGDSWNNSTNFKNKKQTQNAKDIVKALKDAGYRWGGDFTKVDTPHFDSKLDSATFPYDAKFFLNQRMVSENQEIPKEAS
jgi:Putative peptidoglycan binding domain.